MNYGIAIFICCLLLFFLSLRFYLSMRVVFWKKATGSAIRLVLFILLCIALVEPLLRFSSFRRHRDGVLLLLDRSVSMQQFPYHDSIAANLCDILNMTKGSRSRLRIMGFGDSLVRIRQCGDISFHDSLSIFPHRLPNNTVVQARHVLVISDGNWSNTRLFERGGTEKRYHYMQMPAGTPKPYVDVSLISYPDNVVTDSLCTFEINCHGYVRRNNAVSVFLRRRSQMGSQECASRTIHPDTGFFYDTLTMACKAGTPGVYMYTVSGKTEHTKSEHAVSDRGIQHVLPKQITVVFTEREHASLDARFVSLFLGEDELWQRAEAGKGNQRKQIHSPHVSVLFEGGEKTQSVFSASPGSDVPVLYYGGIPGAERQRKIDTIRSIAFVGYGGARAHSGLNAEALTPDVDILTGPTSHLQQMNTYMEAVLPSGKRVPVVFSAHYHNRDILVVAARGVWKWDFIDHRQRNANVAYPFSRYIGGILRNRVVRNLFDTHYAFAVKGRAMAGDSLLMRLYVPSSLQYTDHTRHHTIVVYNQKGDTAAFREDTLDSGWRDSISLGTLPYGNYHYISRISAGSRHSSYQDTMFVAPCNEETMVYRQNSVVLDHFATAFPAAHLAGYIDSLQRTLKTSPQQKVTSTISLERTWLLLGCIIALFGLEWYLRRRWRME